MRTFATEDGRTLSYRLTGDGPLVIMLPGGPGLDPEAFFAHGDLPGFQQLLLCPRGTGESDPPDSPDGYRIAGYVQDLEELRRHLDVEQMALYGSSHGGSIALAYAAAHPGRVRRMSLSSCPARMDGAFAQALGKARERFQAAEPDNVQRLMLSEAGAAQMRTAVDSESRVQSMRAMMDSYVARPGPVETAFLDELCAAPMNFPALGPMAQEMMGGLDLLQSADRLSAPTLLLAGELDVRVPREHMQQIADAIPGARLTSFPQAGHLPHVEAHEEWVRALEVFFGSEG